jgi:hypothetical protein
MKKLSKKLAALLMLGIKSRGSYDQWDVFPMIEERLTSDEATDAGEFLDWVIENQRPFGGGMLPGVWFDWQAHKAGLKAKVAVRDSYDYMSVKVTFPSKGSLFFSITRSGEKLVAGVSMDERIGRYQMAALERWVKLQPGETSNKQRMERIAKLAGECVSVGELVAKIDPPNPRLEYSKRRKGPAFSDVSANLPGVTTVTVSADDLMK